MFSAQVEPRLARLSTGVRLLARELRVAGMGESDVDQRIAPIYTRHDDVQTTILTAPGEIQVHLRTWSADAPAAERTAPAASGKHRAGAGRSGVHHDGESMEEVVARELTLHHATIATAESCTGGLLAERLTRISGSSAYFLGGVVSYSNTLKSAWVDVPAEIIESRGAVSAEVAIALADGIRRRTGATLGVGITGVAGPTGGSPEKPVGTVHVAIADAAGSKERVVRFPRRTGPHPLAGIADGARPGAAVFPLCGAAQAIWRADAASRARKAERVRLFVALDIPEAVRAAIGILPQNCALSVESARGCGSKTRTLR